MNYREIVSRLRKISPYECEREARLLLESLTGASSAYILCNPDQNIDCPELEDAIRRREAHEPIQYILGKWDFYRQTYRVNENCLIPRQDTEILVEAAIERLPKGAFFADLCTGSGCIAVSVLAERSDTSAIMVDKFEKTLALAKENAELNGVANRVKPILSDILSDDEPAEAPLFDAILSNPPYIRPEIIEQLSDEVKKEPYAALCGGDDGLLFYTGILSRYSHRVKKGGFMLLEIGYDQARDVARIASEKGYKCTIIKDYGGNDRVALIQGF